MLGELSLKLLGVTDRVLGDLSLGKRGAPARQKGHRQTDRQRHLGHVSKEESQRLWILWTKRKD